MAPVATPPRHLLHELVIRASAPGDRCRRGRSGLCGREGEKEGETGL